jgi:hypothetical protein
MWRRMNKGMAGWETMTQSKPIYVETKIDAEMEELWDVTQNPEKHQQWDMRFSSITYLPKETDQEPQQFLYRTNIGFGLNISGKGESVKTISKDNSRSSSLKFWSNHPLSLISIGSGYWKYIQEEDGIKFLTLYQYETRFGILGKLVDTIIFRPLMGWATAWSFDCMRLWLEKGIHPKTSYQKSFIHWLCIMILSFIWVYQGIVPKLLFPNSGEIEILRGSGVLNGYEQNVLFMVGICEVIFGLLIIVMGKKKGIYVVNIILLLLLTLGALFSQPVVFIEPFNPITLNLAMIGFSIIGILSLDNLVNSARCKRSKE